MGAEHMPFSFKICSQFLIVINLAVANDYAVVFLITHGLRPSRNIDNCKPGLPEQRASKSNRIRPIRPSMRKSIKRPRNFFRWYLVGFGPYYAKDSTHTIAQASYGI